jgi:uncharacterized protein (TIGR02001 family)
VFSAAPACGQVAIEVALQSDHRVRGFSISDEEPVAAATLSYDDPSGLYAGGTVVGATREGEPGIVSLQGNIGYARRISPDLSLDVGLSRFEYFSSYGSARDYHYTEAYLGVATRNFAARVRYSPDYIRPGAETLYAEIDGGMEVAENWLISAHVGALQYLEERPGYQPQRRYDWRLGVTRRIGAFGVHLDLVGRLGRTRPLPPGASRPGGDRTTLVASLTRAF